MPEFIELSRKYSDHGFLVSRTMDRFGRRYLISAPEKSREEVNEFAEECLGPGMVSQIRCIDGTWTYRLF